MKDVSADLGSLTDPQHTAVLARSARLGNQEPSIPHHRDSGRTHGNLSPRNDERAEQARDVPCAAIILREGESLCGNR